MKHILFCLSILALLCACTKNNGEEVYTMGFTPAENAEVMTSNGKFITDVIQKKTGIKIKSYVATDYTALIEAMRGGQVQFAWFAPFGLVLAEKHADAKVLLKSVRNKKPYFYACIFVRKDRGFKSLQDLKGRSMAWVDPASTSGFIVPKAGLMEMGIDPDKFFGKQIFAGGHDSVVLGVLNASVDAGATFTNDTQGKSAAWTMLNATKPEDAKKIKVIWASKPIPNDTFSTTEKFYRKHKDVVDKVVKAVMDLNKSKDGKDALWRLYRIDSFVEAKSEDFEPLRKAAEKLNIDINKK